MNYELYNKNQQIKAAETGMSIPTLFGQMMLLGLTQLRRLPDGKNRFRNFGSRMNGVNGVDLR
jgi:hypothetical protein